MVALVNFEDRHANPFADVLGQSDQSSGQTYISDLRNEINGHIEHLSPAEDQHPASLHRAMRHSLFGSGKRVRPLLCLLVNEAAGSQGRQFALDAGCAIEMVHTASLILDDLPSMDDAQLRRGRATTHRDFGEATAILAAVGLLNRAYGVIAQHPHVDASIKSQAVEVLSHAVGSNGMIAGQEIDLHERRSFDGVGSIEGLNWLKTGVLFVAAAQMGALAAGLEQRGVEAVREFAKHVGMAFQTADDLVDQSATEDAAGKDVRQDDNIPTLVTLVGKPAAKLSCQEHLQRAREALDASGLEKSRLQALVNNIFGSVA